MVVKVADNITSPMALTTDANFAAVSRGESSLRFHRPGSLGVQEPFFASMFAAGQLDAGGCDTVFTRAEIAAVMSVTDALGRCSVDAGSPSTVFIVSTTKGNVELLDRDIPGVGRDRVNLGSMAEVISRHFGNPGSPVVVSNACISGVSAIILAKRLLEAGRYDNAVVVGVDVLSKFIVSGFQSFKALSPEACKPFDASRCGLNLGEAAATVILSRTDEVQPGQWIVSAGAVRNDANHISGPSRVGEGSFQAVSAVIKDIDKDSLAVINVHGTATMYNDEMESIALERALLGDVPVNAFKGYYGHTLGAAGILESVLTMKALDHSVVLGTRGFDTIGVSRSVNVSKEARVAHGHRFVKMLSGFGGSNAAVLFEKGGAL